MNVTTVPIETKFLRLRQPVPWGHKIDGWSVCWLGGWDQISDVFHRDGHEDADSYEEKGENVIGCAMTGFAARYACCAKNGFSEPVSRPLSKRSESPPATPCSYP